MSCAAIAHSCASAFLCEEMTVQGRQLQPHPVAVLLLQHDLLPYIPCQISCIDAGLSLQGRMRAEWGCFALRYL